MDFHQMLLVSDFDRTLTDAQSQVPQANLTAIAAFQAEGGLFTVGTGRSVPMFGPYQAMIPNNAPLILYNGICSYDYATGVAQDVVPLVEGKALLKDLMERYPHLWYELQAIECHYLLGQNPLREQFYRQIGAPYCHTDFAHLEEPLLKIAVFGQFRVADVDQFFHGDKAEREEFDHVAAYITQSYGDTVTVERAAPRILDLQHSSVSKGKAARRLAQRLGRSVLVCAGDALNDASMLQEADFAFVPADAQPEILAMGFPTVCPCGQGAIAGVIRRLREL